MRFRTLLAVGGVTALIGVAAGLAVEAMSDPDDSSEFAFIVAGLAIVASLAVIGFLAGWFGRERDDVMVACVGAGIVAAIALAIAAGLSDDVAIGAVVVAGGVAIVGAVLSAATWWIGNLICDARELPTVQRLVAPAYARDHPGHPLWTTDAGPALRATLDQLADAVAPGEPVDARAVGIVPQLPRDLPVVVLLTAGRLTVQPVDLDGAANGDRFVIHDTDIAQTSTRSVKPDGRQRQINEYDDVITIRTVDGSQRRLRLPYGTRGVGTTTPGPEVIRQWLMARSGIDR